ncbi:MAG: chromosomal replication initiator protein DnaA, partial [Helicobacteraceae bacterium]|nr:chromosomal replication initiator protein DnaA [Helicobacteraceae bacterium]
MIFDSVISELKGIIPNDEFTRYIAPLSFVEEESKSDQIILEAPNPYIAMWAKTKYEKQIGDIFEKICGGKHPMVMIRSKNNPKSTANINSTMFQDMKFAKSTLLNPSYTFESFVVGNSNQFAFTVAKAVSEKLGSLYNPVFIYGGVGLGKTHLLQAIGNEVVKENKLVIYSTSEQFTNDFTYHLRNQTPDRFRDKYRSCDLLLIDDIQFLSGKEGTQEAFFHTFNELHAHGKQIILSADKNPNQIAGLEERLKSRFMWGQTADIQHPELETKIAIIKKKCENDMISIND